MINQLINRRGFKLVISSPSGAGKTTLSKALLVSTNQLIMSVSVTTRARRPLEQEGIDYYFINKHQYQQLVSNDQLLEHAEVYGEFYGTPKAMVNKAIEAGNDVLFDIDWQGTRQLASNNNDDIVSIFILPPSIVELEERLKNRGQDSEQIVKARMTKAQQEINHWQEYNYVIINYELTESLAQISAILLAERLKRSKLQIAKFVDNLSNS